MDMTIQSAMDRVGLAFSLDACVAPHICEQCTCACPRGLVPAVRRFFLYYPSLRQQFAALCALIDMLRLADRRSSAVLVIRSMGRGLTNRTPNISACAVARDASS
jgi:hypothetical protein